MKRGQTALLIVCVLAAAACAELLGYRPTPDRHAFEHRAHAVAGVNCMECHATITIAGDTGPLHLPSTKDCVSCHEAPHDERACGQCHGRAYARDGAIRAREVLSFSHALHLPRMSGDCVRCHVDVERGAEVLRPRMASCTSCHAEEIAKKQCDGCHVDLRHEGTMPDDHLVHDGDFLRGHGARAAADSELCASCHSERTCTGCHGGAAAPLPPERLRFDDVTRAGVHRAGFMARHAEEARGAAGLCTTCHAPSTCGDCHARRDVGALRGGRSPHPTGWLGLQGQSNEHGRAARRDPALCESCHGGAGEALCVGCHRVGGPGGDPHAPGFTSRLRTTEMPCRKCHEGGL